MERLLFRLCQQSQPFELPIPKDVHPMLIIHSHFTDQLLVVDAIDIGDGWSREDLFTAANRMDDQASQCSNMPYSWMSAVRKGIDVVEMPSMSVGDAFVLLSAGNRIVDSGVVEMIGWSELDPAEAAALIRRAEQMLASVVD